MPFTTRQTVVFVAGLAIGIAAAWAVFGRHGDGPAPDAGKKAAAASTKALGAGPVSVAVGACDFKPRLRLRTSSSSSFSTAASSSLPVRKMPTFDVINCCISALIAAAKSMP